MTEAAPETTEAPAQEQQSNESTTETPSLETLQAKIEELTKESRKWESRAKENGSKAREFDEQRKAAMTEAERAAAEAEERGRTAAATEFGKRLATSEIRAAAATAGADLAGVFDFLDLTRFIGDDGEPDTKAIESFVGGLPKKESTPPSFDGGSRTPAAAQQGMTGLIRKAAGRA
jgi:hypothetical protein